ncbi:MAG: PilZ domain-containing protein [Caryophanon sp.]|nr:PilZ domain-containing protein [Caryophanon sp.]
MKVVCHLIFKRQEGFRFSFEQPVKAVFRLMQDGKPIDPQAAYIPAEILNISPKGMEIATAFEIDEAVLNDVQLSVIYCLDTVEIHSCGEITWKRHARKGFTYHTGFISMSKQQQRKRLFRS